MGRITGYTPAHIPRGQRFEGTAEVTCDAHPPEYRCNTTHHVVPYVLLHMVGVPRRDLLAIATRHRTWMAEPAGTWPLGRHSAVATWNHSRGMFIAPTAFHAIQQATFLSRSYLDLTPFDVANCWAFRPLEYFATVAFCSGMPPELIARCLGWTPGDVLLRMKSEAETMVKDPRFIWWARRPELTLAQQGQYDMLWPQIVDGRIPALACAPCHHAMVVKRARSA